MPEIIYHFCGEKVCQNTLAVRWLTRNDYNLFNNHLMLCGQSTMEQSEWDEIYDDATVYCMLFDNDIPAARACVEKYSEDVWEVADIRVMKAYRNKGLGFEVSLCALNYILENGKRATIRTESDNHAMQRVIAKLGFLPLS